MRNLCEIKFWHIEGEDAYFVDATFGDYIEVYRYRDGMGAQISLDLLPPEVADKIWERIYQYRERRK
jgi:hypothetical protein